MLEVCLDEGSDLQNVLVLGKMHRENKTMAPHQRAHRRANDAVEQIIQLCQ